MRSPGRTHRRASPERWSMNGREPRSKHARAHVSMGGLLYAKSSNKFLECPLRGHSPDGGKKISLEAHSPIRDQAIVQSQVYLVTHPAKGVRASPDCTQAAHSIESISFSDLRVSSKSLTYSPNKGWPICLLHPEVSQGSLVSEGLFHRGEHLRGFERC